ncbi:glycosyl transferase [candidate division KSB3 bacterium]|uniref:peptidoglycan glycosyltransferase n=1 Tax=candidate division KSB3 bacterium TaxID=2044937 RepID=A0A9D5JWS1_9BACT|nr:glycosyl transferase [candidate division KSB3 bacterium]MBD3325719.1 glycosyl transferase [candidate division KSB3 bacterium]
MNGVKLKTKQWVRSILLASTSIFPRSGTGRLSLVSPKLLFMLTGSCLVLVAGLLYHDVKGTIRLIAPPATLLLEDRYGQFLAEGGGNTQTLGYWTVPVPLPQPIEAAFLAIEDHRFYDHPGVDLRAVVRAIWNNLTTSRRQGASTIAMQVARMQRTASLPSKRSYWNKLCESITALLLIQKFGHQAVLNHYLEIVPQGNRIHGVAYAARRYFRKPLQDVSWAEAAVLAALPNAPGRMNLFRPEGQARAQARAALILKKLSEQGTLDQRTFLVAQRQLQHLPLPRKEIRPSHSYHAILRVQEALADRHRSYARSIRTSLDLRLQQQVDEIAERAITYYRNAGAGNIAAIVAEKDTGKVVAYIGSNAYYETGYAGAINYARLPRSSGSTLKPFLYALGLETGAFTPASLLSDAPIWVSLPGGYARIGNYDRQNRGQFIYRKALANSRNVPAIHVLTSVGIDNAYELFRQLGLVSSTRSAEQYGVGLAIGTLYVTLEDLVAAYGVLANEGQAFRLRWVEGDTPASSLEEQWLDQNVARQMSLFLSDPLARLPVFSRMGPLEYPFPVAVKTGTSQGFRDAWAVAYSSKYLVGVWIGHPDHTRMNEVSGVVAAQVVKDIMLRLHPQEKRGVAESRFPLPEGYTAVPICAQTGRPPTPSCPEVFTEYFRPGAEPIAHVAPSEPPALAQQPSPRFPTAHLPPDSPFSLALTPFAYDQLLHASITIQEPRAGGSFVLDPDTPRSLQTIALRAEATPRVTQITWHIDGSPFTTVSSPYTVRWPLQPGTHTIQARFANADVKSEVITITVY